MRPDPMPAAKHDTAEANSPIQVIVIGRVLDAIYIILDGSQVAMPGQAQIITITISIKIQ